MEMLYRCQRKNDNDMLMYAKEKGKFVGQKFLLKKRTRDFVD